ncbi:MAG: hypothetical protein HOC70_17790 [Gammaproteobacteria bacterium]|nr:hypothetical protein [Gammaproteobacteria bacterium]
MTLQQTGRLLITFLALIAAAARADLVATVDRTIISDADLVTLTVRASDETANTEPDFSGLNKDFEVISLTPQRNNSFTMINGQTSRVSYVDYVIRIAPRRQGELSIPPIRAGSEVTRAIPIRVQRQTISQQQRMDQYVFFETTVDSNEVYVQGQIIYSVKLFYTEAIGGDFPQPPTLTDTVVETIENEKRYESIVSGKRYYVLEKRYAIFPQRSGELVFPRERFTGSRGRGGIFARKQSVGAISESHTVRVNTIPESFSGENWIPAKALGIKESWTEPSPIFRVGEPMNRTITLSAIGLSSAVLPAMTESTIPNAKVYADPPTTENRIGEDGISALQITTIGIVPTAEGELYLPEIKVPWWNTQTGREEIATIPASTFTVLPALGETVTVPTVTVPVTELTKSTVVQQVASRYWQWAAIALGLLFLFSTWQWLALRRQVRILESMNVTRYEAATFDDPDEQREFKGLKQACTRNRAADAHRQLFLWAKARYPELNSVNELAKNQPDLAPEIEALESHLYARDDDSNWRGADLLTEVDRLRNKKAARTGNKALEKNLNPA